MSNKIESIKNIISMNDSHVLSEEAVIETIRHIISPEKDQAKVAVQRPGGLDFVVGCSRCKYPLDQCKCYKNDIVYLSKGNSKLKSSYKTNGLYTPDLGSGSILSSDDMLMKPELLIDPEVYYKENVERVFPKEGSLVKRYKELKCPDVKASHEEWHNYYKDSQEIINEAVEKLVPKDKQDAHKEAGWGVSGYRFRHERGEKPSELVLVEYSSPEYLGLPEHARGVIEMIEAEEYRIFKEYSETKNDWARICYIDEDDNEVIEWVDLTNGPVDYKLDEYEKFLQTAIAEISNEKNKENVVVEDRDEVLVLKDLFNLHVSGVNE